MLHSDFQKNRNPLLLLVCYEQTIVIPCFSHRYTLPFEFRIGFIDNFTCDGAQTIVIPCFSHQDTLAFESRGGNLKGRALKPL